MKKVICTGLALALFLTVGIVLSQTPMYAQDDQGPKEVLENIELMELLMDPAYWGLRDNLETEPKGRQPLRTIYISAYSMAEYANLMMFRKEETYKEKMSKEDWVAQSIETRELSASIGAAVKTRDYATMKTNYIALIDVCNKCHANFEEEDAPKVVYWKSEEDKAKEEKAKETAN